MLFAILNHVHKAWPYHIPYTADAVIRVDPGHLPFWIAIDQPGVIIHLIFKAALLLLLLCTDTAIGRNPQETFSPVLLR